jgi:hypothetical protein
MAVSTALESVFDVEAFIHEYSMRGQARTRISFCPTTRNMWCFTFRACS